MTTIELAAALEDAALELWIDSEELDGERILTPEALSVLAGAIGRDERLWRQHARHEHDVRFTQLLHRQANLDVWLLCWLGAQETGLHDHEVSAGAFYVCEGRLVEDILLADASGSVRTEVQAARAGARRRLRRLTDPWRATRRPVASQPRFTCTRRRSRRWDTTSPTAAACSGACGAPTATRRQPDDDHGGTAGSHGRTSLPGRSSASGSRRPGSSYGRWTTS